MGGRKDVTDLIDSCSKAVVGQGGWRMGNKVILRCSAGRGTEVPFLMSQVGEYKMDGQGPGRVWVNWVDMGPLAGRRQHCLESLRRVIL